jgi:hypothetical protein
MYVAYLAGMELPSKTRRVYFLLAGRMRMFGREEKKSFLKYASAAAKKQKFFLFFFKCQQKNLT